MHAAVFATGFVDDALRNTVPSVSESLLQLVNAVLCHLTLVMFLRYLILHTNRYTPCFGFV